MFKIKGGVLCYHNGGLGHIAVALIESCTHQGREEFPVFIKNKNLHHYKQKTKLLQVKHPNCDVAEQQRQGKTVIASTSKGKFGRYLIILMGLIKWNNKVPQYMNKSVYKQNGASYQKQLETLALTLRDKVNNDQDWYIDADVIIDVVDYWKNPKAVCESISQCNLTPITPMVKTFCQKTAYTNKTYYQQIRKCFDTVDKVFKKVNTKVELDFFETAVCYALILDRLNLEHTKVQRLQTSPTSTADFIKVLQ